MEHGTLTSDNHAALWHGRFEEGPDADAVAFETSIHVDRRMAIDDVKGSAAHAKMLSKVGIISSSEADKMLEGLASIEKDILNGTLKIDSDAEDIHSFVEATLTDRSAKSEKKYTREEAEMIRLRWTSVFICGDMFPTFNQEF